MREERLPYYYEVLELRPSASNAEIKKAWLELVQVWHPDRFHHSSNLHRKAEARTQMINQAFQTLSDPLARARYDAITRKAAASKPPSRPSPPPRPQPTPRPRPCPSRCAAAPGRTAQARARARLRRYLERGGIAFLDGVTLTRVSQVVSAATRSAADACAARRGAMCAAYCYAKREGLGRTL